MLPAGNCGHDAGLRPRTGYGDSYDPDRVSDDREQLRLYYRSKGYADASVTSAQAEYDPAQLGFTLTFTIEEGPLYRFGDVNVARKVPGEKLRRPLLAHPGALFDDDALDRTTDPISTVSRSGSAQSLQVANQNVARSSVGFGLTWASPLGPLTVNYAVPLTKAATDVVRPLSFGAGGF